MKKILSAALLGLAVALCGVPGVVAPATAQADHGWKLAGKYASYEEVRRAEKKLKARGRATKMEKHGSYWYVYYK